MSIPLIIAINIGAASLLALILTALMLVPTRFRPHRHLHLLHRHEADRLQPEAGHNAETGDHKAPRHGAAKRAFTIPNIG